MRTAYEVLTLDRQPTLLPEDAPRLTEPFTASGLEGPDLFRPRRHLRIVPAKVTGEPHIERSRLTTQTVAALSRRGFGVEEIAAMYDQPAISVQEAVDLERQLQDVVHAA